MVALVAQEQSCCTSGQGCAHRCLASAGGQHAAAGGVARVLQLVLSWVSKPGIDSGVLVGSHDGCGSCSRRFDCSSGYALPAARYQPSLLLSGVPCVPLDDGHRYAIAPTGRGQRGTGCPVRTSHCRSVYRACSSTTWDHAGCSPPAPLHHVPKCNAHRSDTSRGRRNGRAAAFSSATVAGSLLPPLGTVKVCEHPSPRASLLVLLLVCHGAQHLAGPRGPSQQVAAAATKAIYCVCCVGPLQMPCQPSAECWQCSWWL